MPDIIDNIKVGEYIKKLLKKHNMTQDDLAEALSVSKSAVSQNLRGKSSFDIQNLIQIAKLFEITLDELLNLKTYSSEEVISEYQRVVQKGLSAISQVPIDNLRIAQPDLYGKVLMDYILESKDKEMFLYIKNSKVLIVEDYYHRAKEVYLKVIRYMLEEELEGVLDYILIYTRLNGSFDIEDEKEALIIWGLLDKPSMQNFTLELINYKPMQKSLWRFKNNESSSIPLTKMDFIDIISVLHLKNVLATYMKSTTKDENLYLVVSTFIDDEFIEGIHLYIDYYYKEPISWVRKYSVDVQNTFLEVVNTKDFEIIRKFAEKGLFTDLTPIIKKTIEMGLYDVSSHLIATYHDIINFKKIGESCIQYSNIALLKDIMSYLSQDDLNYLLSFVKLNDLDTMIYLLSQGSRIDEKYYNLETFKKINQLIEFFSKKGETFK